MNHALARIEDIMLPVKISEEINRILEKHEIDGRISAQDFTLTAAMVTDGNRQDPPLSRLIAQSIWPSVKKATVYHYTDREKAERILKSGIFRLSNIERRLPDGEISEFCQVHNLTGFLAIGLDGEPIWKSLLMPNTYYASFTGTDLTAEDEEYFWNNFAGSDGVRFKFEIESQNMNFRKVHYGRENKAPIPLFDEIRRCLKEKFFREFYFASISTLCAFYIQPKYTRENEYRMLYRVFPDGPCTAVGSSGVNSYIELPLGAPTSIGYSLKLTEVHARERPDMPEHYVFSERGE